MGASSRILERSCFQTKVGLGVIDSEHVLFILACFVSHLEGVKLDRVVYKFKEEKCEKVHRLVAMFGVYLEREEAPQEEEEEGGRGQ